VLGVEIESLRQMYRYAIEQHWSVLDEPLASSHVSIALLKSHVLGRPRYRNMNNEHMDFSCIPDPTGFGLG
jgi:hypothetical protein